MLIRWCGLILLLGGLCWPALSLAQTAPGPLYVVRLDGIVTSVSLNYVQRAIDTAEAANASALIVQLAARGGVLNDLRPFLREVAEARVPIVVYITPSGTDSGIAGSLLTSAAHIAVMAPGTSMGSAFPLARPDQTLSTATRDLLLDNLASQLRQWNDTHGRNVEWIDRAVREGAQLTNEQAISLQPPAVNLVAADLPQLLTLLDGRMVVLSSGRQVVLNTLGRQPMSIAPTLWEQLRLFLADPTVAFTLLVLGALAIYLEFAAPGTTLFAGLGAILLIGALLGLVTLPLNAWAMALIIIGLLLIGLEFVIPIHGGLLIGGLVLLVIGGLNLIDLSQAPGAGVSGWAVLGVGSGLAVGSVISVWVAVHSRKQPVRTGPTALIGQIAEVRQRLEPEGMVFVEGALWRAISEDGPIDAGEWVKIAGVHQLRLLVKRA